MTEPNGTLENAVKVLTEEIDEDEVTFLYWILALSGVETHTGWWDSRLAETPEPTRSMIRAKIEAYRAEWVKE